MSAASSPRFPQTFSDDTDFFREAFRIFLRQSGYGANCPFTDLTVLEQRTVLGLAQKLKQEASR